MMELQTRFSGDEVDRITMRMFAIILRGTLMVNVFRNIVLRLLVTETMDRT
jgi:hypothetical protein